MAERTPEMRAVDYVERVISDLNAERQRCDAAVNRIASIDIEEREAKRVLNALLARAALPTSEWRERAPTAAEVEAHDGLWLCDFDGTPEGLAFVPLHVDDDGVVMADLGSDILPADGMGRRWRPYNRDVNPVPWPVVGAHE